MSVLYEWPQDWTYVFKFVLEAHTYPGRLQDAFPSGAPTPRVRGRPRSGSGAHAAQIMWFAQVWVLLRAWTFQPAGALQQAAGLCSGLGLCSRC